MDLRANIDNPVTLRPMERRLIPTGLYIALPPGYEAQVRPRSGLALKHGVTVLNTPGTIDADYRGEVMVLLVNLSDTDFVVADGERADDARHLPYGCRAQEKARGQHTTCARLSGKRQRCQALQVFLS